MEVRPEAEAVETVTLSIVDVVVTSLEVEVMKAVVAVILSLEVVVIMSQEAVAASNLVTTIINHAAEVKEVVMSPEVVVTLNLEEEVVTKAEAEAMSLEIVDVVDTIMITKIDLLVNKDLNAVDMVSNTDPTTKLLLLSQLSRVDLEVEEAVAEEELSQEASKKSPLLLKLKLKTLTVMETTNQNQNNMANTLSSNLVIIKTMAETNSDPNKTTSPIEMTTTSLANITKTTSAITNIKEVGTEAEDVVETSSLETIEAVITILLDKDTAVVTKKMANINPKVMAVEEAITIEEATNLVVGSKIEAVESVDLSEDTAVAATKREVAINLVVDTEVIEETSEEVTTSMEKEVTVVASIMREAPQEAVEMEAISKRTTKAARKITSRKVTQTMKKRNTEDEE
jgi:hypothetical protein